MAVESVGRYRSVNAREHFINVSRAKISYKSLLGPKNSRVKATPWGNKGNKKQVKVSLINKVGLNLGHNPYPPYSDCMPLHKEISLQDPALPKNRSTHFRLFGFHFLG